MSIETLLEAAKFLEVLAQQQQKAREDELKQKLRLQQLIDQRCSDVSFSSTPPFSHVSKADELKMERCPVAIPPSLPPPSMPVTVVPVPVVTPKPSGSPTLPVATLSPPAASLLSSPKSDPHSPQEQSAAVLLCSPQPNPERGPASAPAPGHAQTHQHQLLAPAVQQQTQQQQHVVQRYAGSIVSPPQQQQHTLHPHAGTVLQPAPLQNGVGGRGSPPDDGRQLDSKKRPGGAGTREAHNKLEKDRRAHLKKCFEMLKKNIPNIDEKKTSNLSVLRSALRYIQTLKRKEKEYEHDMERLAREKIATQQRLAELKNDLSQWMDVVEIDRVVRQAVQPEEDQVSTSTASEGEDIMDEDLEEEPAPRALAALPAAPPPVKPELQQQAAAPVQTPAVTPIATATSFITQHVSIQHKAPAPQQLPVSHPASQPAPAAPSVLVATTSTPTLPLIPNHTKIVTTASLHPTVIAHASVSHPSVIQAVNHVLHGGGPKHIAHISPSTAATTTSSVQIAPAHQPIGHITVHPVAHLSQHLPALYPQQVAVTQPAVMGHITHTLNHAHPQLNGAVAPQAAAAIVGKSTPMMAHHPQLVGQTVLNPVTMVTMPSFPISTLKLA